VKYLLIILSIFLFSFTILSCSSSDDGTKSTDNTTSTDDDTTTTTTDTTVTGDTYGGLDGNTNAGGSDLFLVKYNSDGVKQ
jgi:hypothetical protein